MSKQHLNSAIIMLLTALLCVTSITALAQEDDQSPTLLVVNGTLLDDLGQPVSEAQVQFWQTDADGRYDHPDDPNTELRDRTFQFFGTATTDTAGQFTLTTVRPGLYEPRPGHIHFKVWVDGVELLTSQLYFADENSGQPASLIMPLTDGVTAAGDPALVATTSIVVDLEGGGDMPLTPAQAAGPFYPVVDFFGYDNDLTTLGTSENIPITVTATPQITITPQITATLQITATPQEDVTDMIDTSENIPTAVTNAPQEKTTDVTDLIDVSPLMLGLGAMLMVLAVLSLTMFQPEDTP